MNRPPPRLRRRISVAFAALIAASQPFPLQADEALAPDAGESADAELYAEQYGVSVDEAARRLVLQLQVGDFQAELIASQPSFAGLWIENGTEYRVHVAFSDSPTVSLSALAVGRAFADLLIEHSVKYSLSELESQAVAPDTSSTTAMMSNGSRRQVTPFGTG